MDFIYYRMTAAILDWSPPRARCCALVRHAGGVGDTAPGTLAAAFALALLVSTVTTPVGVSGAIFLLPVQVSVLGVPSPQVTSTNLLYNVVANPGALRRYLGTAQLDRDVIRLLLLGATPGVLIGAWIRIYYLPGETVLRVLLASLLVPLGVWLAPAAAPVRGN